MKSILKIDEKDVKILQALLSDIRPKIKDLTNEVGLPSVGIKNRINKMKESGLIVKPILLFNLAFFGYTIPLMVGFGG